MTSTNIFSGNFVDKPTSRVLKPPGGGHSNIFGSSDEQPKLSDAQKPSQPEVQKPSKPSEVQQDLKSKPEMPKPEIVGKETAPAVKAQSFKNKLQGGAFNPITGEPVGRSNEPAPDKTTNSITVRQPPGGASSKLW